LLRHRPPLFGGAISRVVTADRARLELLDGFELRYDGATVTLPMSAQRVLAFVALHRHPVLRTYVAGKLWLESPEDHATSCLRSALWRLRKSGHHELVEAVGPKLVLAPHVSVDAREAADWARRILDGEAEPALNGANGANRFPLLGELLPDWYEDWVLLERERLRELRTHALEALCARLTAGERYGEAMEMAQAVVKLEPLRESAHRLLIRIHLAEGNQSEAIRQYRLYRRLLRDEVGLDPSKQMLELVAPLAVA
jgi:DNA-binding SARP family transcriptional activator